MIDISTRFANAMYNNKPMRGKATIRLKSGVTLDIDGSKIMSDGMIWDEAVSSETGLDIGAAIIGKFTLRIYVDPNDIMERYDYADATVLPYFGINTAEDGQPENIEWVRRGVYTVDKPKLVGNVLSLECLDNMAKLDQDYTTTLTFPATIEDVINDICRITDVSLASGTQIYNKDFIIDGVPTGETLTYRMMLSYAVQLSCSYSKCNTEGEIVIGWYDLDILPKVADGGVFDRDDEFVYKTGSDIDGGNFFDYSSGDVFVDTDFAAMTAYEEFTRLYSCSVEKSPVYVTGVRASVTSSAPDGNGGTTEQTVDHMAGSEGYVLDITGNPLITESNADNALQSIADRVVGLDYYIASFSVAGNPAVETGDVGILTDLSGRSFTVLVTNLVYTINGKETIRSTGESAIEASTKRYSNSQILSTQVKQTVLRQTEGYKAALSDISALLSQSMGFFVTMQNDPDTGAMVAYMHDKPAITESMIIWKQTADSFAVSTDGGQTWNAGITADGNAAINLLSVAGITFDWAKGGELSLGGHGNGDGVLRVYDSNDNVVGYIDNTGLHIETGEIAGTKITSAGSRNNPSLGTVTTDIITLENGILEILTKLSTGQYFYDIKVTAGGLSISNYLNSDTEMTSPVLLLSMNGGNINLLDANSGNRTIIYPGYISCTQNGQTRTL